MLQVLIEAPGRISGQVLDTGSGAPVAEFSIQAYLSDARQAAPIYRQVETDDAAGRFFDNESLPGPLDTGSELPAYLPQKTIVEIRSGQTSGALLRLERAGSILGLVLDAASESPVDALSVQVVDFKASGGSLPNPGRVSIDESQKGVFLIEDISPGTVTLLVEAPG